MDSFSYALIFEIISQIKSGELKRKKLTYAKLLLDIRNVKKASSKPKLAKTLSKRKGKWMISLNSE